MPRRQTIVSLLALALVLAPLSPARAGLMDSITGFFGKAVDGVKGLFGGGSKASKNGEFEGFLEQLESSQASLHEQQTALIEYYNQTGEGVTMEDSKAQELSNAVADASRANEDLYLQYLQVRAQVKESGADLSGYEERMATITENQKRLEEGYQSIQDFNRDSGLFTPPPADDVADEPAASGNSGEISVDDPEVQALIDQWLGSQGRDPYGRQLGSFNGTRASASQGAETGGRSRHQYVWDLFADSGLRAYVEGMRGGTVVASTEPSDSVGSDITDTVASTDIGESGEVASSPSSSESSEDLDLEQITTELNDAVSRFQELQKSQNASGDEGRKLLAEIKELQAQRTAYLESQSK